MRKACAGQAESLAREQIFTLADGTHVRLDLVVKTTGSVFVVDVTVPFENADKVTEVRAPLKKQLWAAKGEVISIVLGARSRDLQEQLCENSVYWISGCTER